jgi:protein ATS1
LFLFRFDSQQHYFTIMTLYSFGSNGNGQLGQGHTDDTDTPHPVQFADLVTAPALTGEIELAFGGNHTLLLDCTSGRLFGSGDNQHSQLGLLLPSVSQPATTKFVELQLPRGARPVTHIAAGWEFSVVITDDGAVYTAGKGPKGELANGNSDIKQHREFLKVYHFDYSRPGGRVVKAVASMAHVVILLESGELYGWGVSRKGQLGLDNASSGISTRPVAIDLNAGHDSTYKAVDVACGRTFTLVLARDENQAQSVILQSNDKTMIKFTEEVSGVGHNVSDPIISVTAGWSAIHVLSQSGQLVSAGNNSHGQLGPADKTALRFVSQSAGTEHYLGVSHSGSTCIVSAWGWGEHGNCGPDYTEARPKGEVYEVFSGAVRAVYGGYASSWILA